MSTVPTADEMLELAANRMAELVQAITDAPSAVERAKSAVEAWEYDKSTFAPAIAAERRQAVRELRAMGFSLRECAELLGVSDSRISQITGG